MSKSTADPHLGRRIAQGGASLSRAKAALVMLHGRGGGPDDMLDLAARLGLPDLACIAPEAAGHSWWPQSVLTPLEQNEPGLSSGLDAVAAVVDGLERESYGRGRGTALGHALRLRAKALRVRRQARGCSGLPRLP